MSRISCAGRGLVAALIALAASAALASSAGATTITVNTVDDDGTAGDCELREAILAARDNGAEDNCPAGQPGPTRDVIVFSIGGAGSTQTIVPALFGGSLPSFGSDPVEIDGRNGAASTVLLPRIEIDATASSAGLVLTGGSGGNFIHHVAVYDAGDDGIRVQNDNNVLSNLVVGLDLTGADHPNGSNGIEVRGAGNTIAASVISANTNNGIDIADDGFFSATTGTTITGNRIGTNIAGTTDHGNLVDGISISAGTGAVVAGTTIGGTTGLTPGGACTGDCNVISGNNSDGIDLNMTSATTALTGTVVRGNFIGTDAPGTGAVANATGGMRVRGHVDGLAIRDNLVSGNAGDGVTVFPGTIGGPSNSAIAGNRIGTTTTTNAALPNTGRGINLSATVLANQGPMTNNVIGGTADPTPGGACDGDCNVISGNGLDGVLIFRGAGGPIPGTQVLGNYVGTNSAGTGAVANNQWGVVIGGGSGASIGSPAAPNVISGNGNSGVLVQQNTEGGNRLEGNRIGTTADGSGALGNTEHGVDVSVSGSGMTVGGTAATAGNVIANNVEAGVSVNGGGAPTASTPILGNSIHDNGGLGIDLMPDGITAGITPNDGAGDPDTGGNGFQNFPVLDTVAVAGSQTYVRGTLDSTASTSYRIEVFANTTADPSGNGEGAALVGSFEVATDATGHAAFFKALDGTIAAGRSTTATATRLDGSGNPVETSEFAANLAEGCDITGTADADTLTGTAAAEVICGLGGDDAITGLGSDDVMAGGDGTDSVSYAGASSAVTVDLAAGTATGGAGSDTLVAVEGASGSSFGDQLIGTAAGSALIGAGGSDTLTGGAGSDSLDGGDGNDTLEGAGAADQLLGGGGADNGSGGEGGDSVAGGGGNDVLSGGNGSDTVNGDDDDDALAGGAAGDTLNGGGGADALAGDDGNDVLDGGGGLNTFDAGAGNDTYSGGGNAETGTGGDGDDTITGADGDDTLAGGTGNDSVDGGGGNDALSGEDGDDVLAGVDGDDSSSGGIGNDRIDAGPGSDTADGDDGDDNLLGQSGDDALTGGAGDDDVQSQGGRDEIEGSGGDDVLKAGGGEKDKAKGGGGDDTVKGGGGEKDDVRGGGGKDNLDGGGGKKDKCDGGSGKDRKSAPGCESKKSIP